MLLREQVRSPVHDLWYRGAARYFVEATDEHRCWRRALCAGNRLPLFVLGQQQCSGVRRGFSRVVLHVAMMGVEQDGNYFRVAAGGEWDSFVSLAIERGYGASSAWRGFRHGGRNAGENVGAYGQEVSTTITAVRILDRNHLTFGELPATCGFSYRRSIFNSTHRTGSSSRGWCTGCAEGFPRVVVSGSQALFSRPARYADSAEVAAAVREIRIRKDASGEGIRIAAARSFFKNPVVPQRSTTRLGPEHRCRFPAIRLHEDTRRFRRRGWWSRRDFRRDSGKARGISNKHTLALINRGDATATIWCCCRSDRGQSGAEI